MKLTTPVKLSTRMLTPSLKTNTSIMSALMLLEMATAWSGVTYSLHQADYRTIAQRNWCITFQWVGMSSMLISFVIYLKIFTIVFHSSRTILVFFRSEISCIGLTFMSWNITITRSVALICTQPLQRAIMLSLLAHNGFVILFYWFTPLPTTSAARAVKVD